MWREPGWPFTHEGPAFFQRTLVYARHLAAFDLLPVWSSADAFGFGSPMPLMYHKLFYMLAAPIALATNSLKLADAIALLLMLVVGALGMYVTARALQASRLAASVAGVSLIAANYTVTLWLVRGNVAELSGMMLVPWLLHFATASLRDGRLRVGLGVTLALMWMGHSILAFYAVLLVAMAGLPLTLLTRDGRRLLSPRSWWPALLTFVVLVGPYLGVMRLIAPAYDFSRILTPPFRPIDQFRPMSSYFWDRSWQFGQTMAGLTTQLDLPMLALGALVIGFLIAARLRRTPHPAAPAWVELLLPLAIGGCALVLQASFTNAFYESVPGATYIQFPWRLLSLITPCLILCAICLADAVLPERTRLVALGAVAAWMIAGSGALVPIHDPRFLQTEVSSLHEMTFSGFREYEPALAPPTEDTRASLAEAWRTAGCRVERRRSGDEVVTVEFDVSCEAATSLPLPIYRSPFHSVRVGMRPDATRCFELEAFPTLCSAIVPAGSSVVGIRIPTVAAVIRQVAFGRPF